MSHADEPDEEAGGADRNTDAEHAAGGHRIDIGGNAYGPVVAGDHNLVVDARHGSSVTVVNERQRPAPKRRERISVLPRRQREPLGRESAALTLAGAIAEGGPVQLCGPAGVGKSTLLRYAATVVERGPDGVVFVSAAHRQVADIAQEIFEACYETRGYAPSRNDLRRLLADVRITVYIDDADLGIDQLRQLTDMAPSATFVFAGREGSLGGEGTVLYLEGLDRFPATQLLARGLGRPLLDGEGATADELWRAAGGNPLLLLRTAGLARSGRSGWPGQAGPAGQSGQAGQAVHPRRSALPPPGAVADLLPLLLDQRDEAELRVLNVLATLAGADLAPAHVHALTGIADADQVCRRLADLGLAVAAAHGYGSAPDVGAALRRRSVAAFPVDPLCRYFAQWAADPATAPEQVAGHSRALEQAAELATAAGRPDLAVLVGRAASPKMAHSLQFEAWGRLLGRGWSAAQDAGDREAAAYFTHEEAMRCLVIGQRVAAAALLAEAVVLWNTLGDDQGSTAATQAQEFLPPAPQPPQPAVPDGTGAAESQAVDAGYTGDTGGSWQTVADHMAELTLDPAVRQVRPEDFCGQPPPGVEQAGCGVPDGSGHAGYETPAGADQAGQAGYGTPPGAEHAGFPGQSAPFPDGGAFGTHAATATGPASSGGAGAGAAAGGTTAGTAAGGAAATGMTTGGMLLLGTGLLTLFLVVTATAGAVFVVSEVALEEVAGDDGSVGSDPNGLAGTWEDEQGAAVRIEETGPGTYSVQAACGEPDVELTGDSTRATGKEPLFDAPNGGCGPVVGYADVTITVGPDGDTAEYTTTMTAEPEGTDDEEFWECYTCGTENWTRLE
ncbi:hypothetical protein GCM10027570_13370 [Streptomonospora sediminis]